LQQENRIADPSSRAI